MADDLRDPEPKLVWAREALGAREAAVFPMMASGPDEAAARYMADRGSDLLIMSREVILPDPERRLEQIEAQSVWAWRTPVLVC